MLINFPGMEETVKENIGDSGKNGRMRTYEDDMIKTVLIKLEPGAIIPDHKHETNCDLYYVVEGKGKAYVDGVEENLQPGFCHYCPKGSSHGVNNDSGSELVLFALVPKF